MCQSVLLFRNVNSLNRSWGVGCGHAPVGGDEGDGRDGGDEGENTSQSSPPSEPSPAQKRPTTYDRTLGRWNVGMLERWSR